MTNNHVNKSMGTYKIKDMIVNIYFSPKVIETLLQMKRYINSIT